MSAAVRSSDSGARPSARIAAKSSGPVDRIRSGPLRSKDNSEVTWCQPLPTSPSTVGIRHEDRSKMHLIEVVRTRHQNDGFDADAVGIARHQELAEPVMSVLRVRRAGASQHDHLMRMMRSARPHLRAGQQPAAVGADGLGLHCGQIGSGAVFAHSDRRIELARNDLRQQSLALLLGAIGQQAGRDLTVGDPVRRYRRPGSDQFLGDHVAVQMPQPVAPVLLAGWSGRGSRPHPGAPRTLRPTRSSTSRRRVASRIRRDRTAGSPARRTAFWPARVHGHSTHRMNCYNVSSCLGRPSRPPRRDLARAIMGTTHGSFPFRPRLGLR